MCTNPLLVRNRKYRDISDKLPSSYISVPCGVCDECLSRRANDLYVRARYEYDACLKNGGIGFMCCLTYDDLTMPYLYHLGKRYMVFNKKHLIDFFKRLRTNLDRTYKKSLGRSAPDFKYLVTCEYGTDPTKTHRPHYHILIFFNEFISHSTFSSEFFNSIYRTVGKEKKRVFGYIFQCDVLDPKRGGIKYSGKYVLKDLMFENQRQIINEKIKFWSDYVTDKFDIIPFPETSEDFFHNKCVRSSKAYRKAISLYVLPYRHMLQFYMCSNDLGISAIIRKYGKDVLSLPCLNFEGFPFAFPKLLKQRIAENYGSKAGNELRRKIFVNYVNSAFNFLEHYDKINKETSFILREFASTYIYPFGAELVLFNPTGLDLTSALESSVISFEDFVTDYNFFSANGFYDLRSQLLHYLRLYDSKENRDLRASLAYEKRKKQKEEYEKRRYNKPYKLF